MAYHLLKELKDSDDLNLSAILLNDGRLAHELRKEGITVNVVDEDKSSFFEIALVIRKLLRKTPPDLIHSHRYKENTLAYLVSKSLRGTRLVGTQHGMSEVHEGKITLKDRFIRKLNFLILSRCFHRVIVVSQDIQKAFVEKHGFRKNTIRVIHNGIAIPGTLPKKSNSQRFVIGSAGRLFPVKDYALMVEVAKDVNQRNVNVEFKLAGDGPEMPKLKRLVQKYGLEKCFQFLDHVDDMSTFYDTLDIYLNTSTHEGIPMTVLEAMAYGIPVVAPAVGGLVEIIDNEKDGCLIESRSPELFAEKCLELIRNDTLRYQLSIAAREKTVNSFSVQKMAEDYLKVYLSLTEAG